MLLPVLALSTAFALADDPSPPPAADSTAAPPPATTTPAPPPGDGTTTPPPTGTPAPTADGSTPPADGTTPPPTLDISEALKTRDLTASEVKELQPKRWKLPQDPYGQTDFTAYCLEWGEVKLGVTGVTVGVLPRVQLGTNPILDALRLPNGALKWDFARLGPVDLAGLGDVYVLPTKTFTASFVEAGAMTSIQILKPWSVHLSGVYDHIAADGLPDFSKIPDILQTVNDTAATLQENNTNLHLAANALTVRLATDYRFNRRDSILLRSQAVVWSGLTAHATSDLPAIAGLDSILGQDKANAPVSIANSFIVSLSYQLTFKHVDLRGGYGVESVPDPPFAWVLGAWDASYRLGGETRRSETRMKKTWLQNLRDVRKARKEVKGTPTEGAAEKKDTTEKK